MLFSPDPFGTGGKIEQANWADGEHRHWREVQRASRSKVNGIWRKVNHFHTIGFVPIDHLSDNGFALQVSAMPIKDLLQAYVTASKIWGANGNPNEVRRRRKRLSVQAA